MDFKRLGLAQMQKDNMQTRTSLESVESINPEGLQIRNEDLALVVDPGSMIDPDRTSLREETERRLSGTVTETAASKEAALNR